MEVEYRIPQKILKYKQNGKRDIGRPREKMGMIICELGTGNRLILEDNDDDV